MRIIQLCIFFLFLSCNNHGNTVSKFILKNEKGEDEIAILQEFPKQTGTTFYQLTNNDVILIEQIINKEVDSLRGLSNISDYEKPEKLQNYIRQYLGYINRDGDKEVFIFCVSKERKYPKWKKELILTVGGGNSVFKGAINLSKEKSLGFSINAPL